MKSMLACLAPIRSWKKAFIAGAAIAFLLASYGSAQAVALSIPGAIYSGTEVPTAAGPGTYTFTQGPGNSATVTFTAIPAPSITLHVVGGGTDPNRGFSTDGLTYFYQIFGPQTDNNLVAVQMATTMNVSTSGFVTTANATLALNGIMAMQVCAGNSNCDLALGSQFSGILNELLPFSGFIQMGVSVNVYSGVGDAYIDPVFTLPTGYSILFSPGVGNSPAAGSPTNVPEPTTLALIGLGLLGFAASRRKSANHKKA